MKEKINFSIVKSVVIGFVLLIGFSILTYWLSAYVLGKNQIQSFVIKAGIWGPLLIILAKASTLIIAPLGGNPIYILAGALYGFIPAVIYSFLGDLLGSAVSFLIARTWGRKIILKFIGKNMYGLIDKIYVVVGNWQSLVLAWFLGIVDIVNYAAGLTNISFFRYILLFIIFRPIGNVIFVSLTFFPQQSLKIKVIYMAGIVIYAIFSGIYMYKLYKKPSKSLETITKGN